MTEYTISKYGMSMCTLGLAAELASVGIAANSLWPRTTIATAAVSNILGGDESMRRTRRPEIVADAAFEILGRDASFTGNFCLDADVLIESGVTDLAPYLSSGASEDELMVDFFLDGGEVHK